MDKMLTTGDVADRLGVSDRTVRRWIQEGQLKAYSLGPRSLRVRESALRAFAAKRGYSTEHYTQRT